MKIIKLSFIHNSLDPAVASIGNFDGLHLGHQKIFERMREISKKKNLKTRVIIFEPQPQEFFLQEQAPPRLTNLEEKLFYLEFFGIDEVVVLDFDQELKNMSAADFIQNILITKLNIQHLLIGDDFRFGNDRQGDYNLLKEQNEIFLENLPTFSLDSERVSSSKVRQALASNDFSLAKKLLGRPYSLRGEVLHGDKKGRDLGAATANIDPMRLVLPLKGVFAVIIKKGSNSYHGVANIGKRPTVGGVKNLLEVHIFDFNQEIYGEIIEIIFLHKIRDEKKFSGLTELAEQIKKDILAATQYFTNQLTS